MKTKRDGWSRLFFVAAAVVSMAGTISAKTVTLTPEADAFIQIQSPDSNFGSYSYLSAAGSRESLIRFDLSSVSEVTSARIRIYVGQFTGDGKTDSKPVIFRKMKDLDWDEMTATRNNMKHEVPFATSQSAWVGPGDSEYAGSLTANGLGWFEADVTEAVKASAIEDGRISFHAFSPAPDRNLSTGDTTPLTFSSREKPETAPQLVVEYDGEGEAAYGGFTRVLMPTDDVTLDNGYVRRGPGHGSGKEVEEGLLANSGVRSFLMKFNLGRYEANQVESAFLELRGAGAPNAAATLWELLVEDAGDWSEDAIQTDNLPPNVCPRTRAWPGTVPANGVRVSGWNAASNALTRVDVTGLLKQAAAFSSGYVTFQGFACNNYVIAACRDLWGGASAPKLVVRMRPSVVSVARDANGVKVEWPVAAEATAYHVERAQAPTGAWTRVVANTTRTSASDATYPGKSVWWYRVIAVKGETETPSAPVRFYEKPTARATRTATKFTGVFFDNGTKKAFHEGDTLQVGNPDNYRVIYNYLDFDPAGLADAPLVRLRLYGYGVSNATGQNVAGELRLLGAVTDPWNDANVTWNGCVEGFSFLPGYLTDGNAAHPCTPRTGFAMENQIGTMQYGVYGSQDRRYFFEFDVTAVVREAARQGRRATFVLASSHFQEWRFFSSPYHANANTHPMLVYSEVTGFTGVTATDDLTGEKPTTRLTWGGGPVGTTYAVTRTDERKGETITLASGLTETSLTDSGTIAGAVTYRVTATLPDGETLVRSLEHTVDAATKIVCAADAFVYSGTPDTAYGMATDLVMKYDISGQATRETLVRFELTEVPTDARKVLLTMRAHGEGKLNGNERLYFRTMDLDEWTDETAPTWNGAFPNRGKVPSKPQNEGYFAALDFPGAGVPITVDVTAQIAAARAAGKTSLTVHVYMYDAEGQAYFGFYSRENPMDGYAAYLSCVPKNWNPRGLFILVR